MWTFTLIYSTYYTLKYNNAPISHIVVISNVWFGTDAQTIFPPMGAQITSIVFTPMRSELKKLNWSTYPLSRFLSPFVLLVLYIYSLCRGWEQKRKDICAALYFALLTWAPNRGFTVGRQISNIYFRATRWRNQIKSTTFKLPNAFLDTLLCFLEQGPRR